MLNFPTNPNIGDIYSHGFRSWRWDGAVWKSRATTELGTLAFQNAESVDIKGGTISIPPEPEPEPEPVASKWGI